MGRHVVCPANELSPGERKILDVEGRSIGVFNVKGSYYALRNRCPHKGAPLCRGELKDLVTGPAPYEYVIEREGEILRCPWHGWEFDVTNGHSYFNPHRIRVRSYEVTVERLVDGATFEPAVAIGDNEKDPSIETYPVTIEHEMVVLHI